MGGASLLPLFCLSNSLKKTVILIDGENFRHSLKELFPKKFDYFPKKVRWFSLLSSVLANNQELIRIYWYVVNTLIFHPPVLSKDNKQFEKLLKSELITKLEFEKNKENKNQFLNKKRKELKKRKNAIRDRFIEWKKIQNNICHSVNYLEFRRCGFLPFSLLKDGFENEKGVDVKLASDLLESRNISDQVILFSNDQDLIPAIQFYKDAGKQLFVIDYLTKNDQSLRKFFHLRLIADKIIPIPYEKILELIEEF